MGIIQSFTWGRWEVQFLDQFSWGEYAGHALLLRGLAYQKAGNLDKSIQDFIQFLDKYPDHPFKERAAYLLALSYLQSKKWAETFIEAVKKAKEKSKELRGAN